MSAVPLYVIARWHEVFEVNRTRELKTLSWLPWPIDLASNGYCELMSDDDGPAFYGVWAAFVCVAGRSEPRGQLVRRGGMPHDPKSLSAIIRMPPGLIARAIKRFISIGWIISQEGAVIPQLPATIPQEGAQIDRERDRKKEAEKEREPRRSVPYTPPQKEPLRRSVPREAQVDLHVSRETGGNGDGTEEVVFLDGEKRDGTAQADAGKANLYIDQTILSVLDTLGVPVQHRRAEIRKMRPTVARALESATRPREFHDRAVALAYEKKNAVPRLDSPIKAWMAAIKLLAAKEKLGVSHDT